MIPPRHSTVCPHQRRDTLSVARCRARRGGAGGFCHETAGSQGCAELYQARDGALRPAKGDRDGSAQIISAGDVTDRQRTPSGDGALAQQPGRKLTSALPPTRTSNGEIQEFEIASEIRFDPRHNQFNHQRHLNRRDIFKHYRAAALAEWRQLTA